MESQTTALKQNLNNIRKINDEYEQILNHFGIAYDDFSGPNRTNLEEISDLRSKTGLAILDLSLLQEWHCLKIEQNIPKKMAIQSFQCDVSDLDYELVRIQQAMKANERFLEYIKESTKLSAGIDRVFEEKRCEYNLLLDRKNKLKVDKRIDLDEIVHKLESLAK